MRRRYTLHDPGGRKPVATFLAFHGRWSDPAGMRRVSRLDARARRDGAAVVYLHGVNDGWGDNPQPTPARPAPQADIRFAVRLTRRLTRRRIADGRRVYGVGFSNGAGMVLRLAAERPQLLARVGAVAGQLSVGVRVRGPVLAYIVYGARDRCARPRACPARPRGMTARLRRSRPRHPPAPSRTPSRAPGSSRPTVRRSGARPGPRPASPSSVCGWSAKAATPGPGADRAHAPEGVGPTSQAMDATDELVSRLLRHRR